MEPNKLHLVNDDITKEIGTLLEITSKAVITELESILDKIKKVAEVQKITTNNKKYDEIIKKVDDVKRNMASTDKSQSNNT